MKRNKFLFTLLVVCCLLGFHRAATAKVVFDPWNTAEGALTNTHLAKMVGLDVEKLNEFRKTVDLSIQILSQATWIYDAVTGVWSLDDAVLNWVTDRIDQFINQNVPAEYQDLVYAATDRRIIEYFRKHREKYPLRTREEINPWDPDSPMSQYYEDAQGAYDALHATAEQTYDGSADTMRNLEALQKQLPQADVNSSINVLSQIVIENAMTIADWKRSDAVHNKAQAFDYTGRIEAHREWVKFLGVTDPRQQFGYEPPRR